MKYVLYIISVFFFYNSSFAQDLIFKINGDEIEAKVLEITPTEVKYKKYKFQDGPTYVLNKTDVFMIKYPDGQKDVFTNSNSTNSNTTSTPQVRKEDVVANEFVNGGTQQQQTQQQEQYNVRITNTSNPNFKVMHNEIIKTTSSNKEQIDKLVISLEDAILKDDTKKAWEILEQIKRQN